MEINGLGNAYLDDYRLSSSSAVHSSQDFAAILKRAASSESGSSSGSSGPADTKIDKNDKLYQLCLDLETFLVKNLLTTMRNTVQKSGLIDGGFAGKMYEDMLYDEYAKDFTKNANFGLAEQAYLQLKGM